MLAMFLYTGYGRSEEPGRAMIERWWYSEVIASNDLPRGPVSVWPIYGKPSPAKCSP